MHVKRPLEHVEQLVLVVVAVPHKLALDLGDFDVLAVEGSHDVGVPVVGDQVKFGVEVNRAQSRPQRTNFSRHCTGASTCGHAEENHAPRLGELGRSRHRPPTVGPHVIAVDAYAGAPAMQVADEFEVISMLDGDALDAIVAKHQPDIVVPEVESIRTERFYDYEKQGIRVVPSAKAAHYTMNRRAIRDLAAVDLGLKTAPFKYATSLEELQAGVDAVGMPCVVKPADVQFRQGPKRHPHPSRRREGVEPRVGRLARGFAEIIVEAFIDFDYEITLLTLTQDTGDTLFCAPIGHRQERGDYQESWQPAAMESDLLQQAQTMAAAVTAELGGSGIWGVEFFIQNPKDGQPGTVYFSELSPDPYARSLAGTSRNCRAPSWARPHDTGVRW